MNVFVVGLGFVGLTAALGFAEKGHYVTGYDIDAERVKKINKGEIPFLEPGLEDALKRNLSSRFEITADAAKAAKDADCIFFCVGTPCDDNGKADLTYLFSAIDSIIDAVTRECVLVIKSTVPPSTTANDILPYIRKKDFSGSVTNNPEFLREGYCWNDFMNPDRVVCGVEEGDFKGNDLLTKLYAPFKAPVRFVSLNTAEFIKYLSNTMLATLITFSNEMALIADAIGGIDTAKAFRILHEDKRLHKTGISHYIYPGCGFGGYCLPKDIEAMSAKATEMGAEPHILNSVISLNEKMPSFSAKRIERMAAGKNEKIGVLGLSFKPKSDDARYSPAANIIECLLKDGYKNLYVYDPVAMKNFHELYGYEINYCDSKEDVCDMCDTIAIITIWQEFQGIQKKYPNKKFCDCRYWLED